MMKEQAVNNIGTETTKPILYLLAIAAVFYGADVLYSYLTLGRYVTQTASFFSPTESIRGLGTVLLIFFFIRAPGVPGKKIITYTILYYAISYIMTTVLYGAAFGFSATSHLSLLFKYIFSLLLPFFIFINLIRDNIDERKFFVYLRYFLFFCYVVPIYLSWFEIAGFKTYMFNYDDITAGRFGYKGFIYNGNGLSAVLIMITLLFFNFENKSDFVFAFLSLGGGFLLGTKGYILITAFCIILYLITLSITLKEKPVFRYIFISLALFIIIFLSVYYFQYALTRTYQFTSYGLETSDDTLSVLTSGRSGYFDLVLNAFPSLDLFQIILGGMGLEIREVDAFSALDTFGIAGLLIYIVIIMSLLRICAKIYKDGPMHLAVSLALIGLICHSLTGGHVYGFPPTMTPAALVIGLLLYYRYKTVVKSSAAHTAITG